jgi:L-cysteate sulfo-lyase
MQLARFPRVKLAHAPTPLEPMANLTRHLGGLGLWVKRDDCAGLAVGGNEVHTLEFLLGDALERFLAVTEMHAAMEAEAARLADRYSGGS